MPIDAHQHQHLPLPPHDFYILLALLDAPQHAYGLSRAVEAEDGPLTLEIGSLYRILSRLTAAGLIEGATSNDDSSGHAARRKYYRITSVGRRVAAAEAQRLEGVLRLARRHKLLSSKGSS